jgi:hypothetical protein
LEARLPALGNLGIKIGQKRAVYRPFLLSTRVYIWKFLNPQSLFHLETGILNKIVSYQRNTWGKIEKEMSIKETLDEIRSNTHKPWVEYLRRLLADSDTESYKAEKLKLPAVTFCASFDGVRQKEKIKSYNSVLVIDIDKLSNEEYIRIHEVLLTDPYVYTFWSSPSRNGYKGLIPLKFNCRIEDVDLYHKCAFYKLSDYFQANYNVFLDTSGNDTTRLCFFSYDPDLVLKRDLLEYEIGAEDIKAYPVQEEKIQKEKKAKELRIRHAYFNPQGKNRNTHRKEITDIIKFLTRKGIVITGKYEQRYRIGYAISNSFTYDIGLKYFLSLCKIEQNKYNEQRETRLLQYCYENNGGWINFSYIENLVKENGYIKRNGEGSFVKGANQ